MYVTRPLGHLLLSCSAEEGSVLDADVTLNGFCVADCRVSRDPAGPQQVIFCADLSGSLLCCRAILGSLRALSFAHNARCVLE